MQSFLLIVFSLTIFYVSSTSRLEAWVSMIALQGLVFSVMILTSHTGTGPFHLALPLIETFLVKTIILPVILLRTIRKYGVYREGEPYRARFFLMAGTILVFFLAFLLASLADRISPSGNLIGFAVSIASMISGLMVIISRKKVLSHILGYVFFENGIFLLSIILGVKMPLIVHMGVLLDVFTAVFLLLIIYNRIKDAFESVTIDHLSTLKD
jgi:hydrogenase-4 component E